ncbi:hypothetical protein N7478_002001 [Penicillium angulare]|uniref:uncharacterized protein n=1 Tax=Penicillium angulare TaxID=116970 RepID=UPI002540EB09|nr:uncharacterized protein N7478_002001 [Penicillium angulare]KAJ5288971.1 hypothetical protein N7478_002001 [Penicillium angulare]
MPVPDTIRQSPTMGEEMAQFSEQNIMGMKFETPERYYELEPVGIGVSGLVCSSKDMFTRKTVAIKKLAEPFKSAVVAKHMFREIKLLKHLQHDNIIHLKDIFVSPSEEIYLVTDRFAVDLHTLIRSKKLEDQFTQYLLYQIMRGLKYVHSAGVIHRDLKPGNILVNENCDLQICDFGLARTQKAQMTGYVVTRYYRAPEIMLTWRRYDEKVDIWSAACIFAEMIIGRPLFPGKNYIDQFSVITQLLGMPPEEIMSKITNDNTMKFVRSLPTRNRKPLSYYFPKTGHKALSLLDSMLQYNPRSRPSAAETLTSSYLVPYHDPTDEPSAPEKFDWSFLESEYPLDLWKSLMYSEILDFHKGNVGNGNEVPSNIASYLNSMELNPPTSPDMDKEASVSPKNISHSN